MEQNTPSNGSLSKSIDDVARTILRTTPNNKGLPIAAIHRITKGHQNARRMAKNNYIYGQPEINNVGVFQGSSISDLLFIIYLGDMMDDHMALYITREIPINAQKNE